MIWPLIKELAAGASVPTATALVVGGGGSALPALRRLNATRLVMVEADPAQAAELRRRARASQGEEVLEHAVVAGGDGSAVLQVLDNPRYSSLRRPVALHRYMPNIHGVRKARVPAEPIADTIAGLHVDPGASNLLVLDAAGQASELLESIPAADLQRFSRLVVRCPEVPLYEGEGVVRDVLRLLEERGFEPVEGLSGGIFPERVVVLARNQSRIALARLGLELEEARAQNTGLSARLGALAADLADARERIRERDAAIAELREALHKEAGLRETQEQRFDQLQEALRGEAESREAQAARFEQLARELSKSLREDVLAVGDTLSRKMTKATARSVESVSKHIGLLGKEVAGTVDAAAAGSARGVADELATFARNLYRRVDRSSITAAKQVQAFIGVHEYLRSGELPGLSTEAHAWPISPDFAIRLLELMELNDYDTIIEFGSGYSTVIMARALARRRQASPRKRAVDLVAFEHLEPYLQRTNALLGHAGVSGLARVVHAPLVPYAGPDGEEYLYYDCTEVVRDLGRRHARGKSRVLVLVDGPPGKTGRHARYPALPVVLGAFAGRPVDFLMDDYGRAEEQEIVERWRSELSAAGVDHDTQVFPLEKDACLLSVNPVRT